MERSDRKVQLVYLDMDGVIADFNLYWQTHFNQPTVRDDPNVETNWDIAVEQQYCFEKLELCDGARSLIRFLRQHFEFEILSSISDRHNGYLVAKQKRHWLDNHGLADIKSNFVTTKKDKSNFASHSSLLIDDSTGCIDPFIEKGGIGILHKNANDTIIELGKYLKG